MAMGQSVGTAGPVVGRVRLEGIEVMLEFIAPLREESS